MIAKPTNAEFAVLSLLAEAPRHGYEIEQLIEQRGMRNWTEIGFSSIYFLLKKLEGRGFVERTGEAAASRRQPNVFRLTEAGAAAHRDATRQALAEPEPLYPAILLGLANWPALSPREADAALKARETALAARLQDLRERRAEQEPLPAFVLAMFDYSAAMIEAERAFLSKVTGVLKEGWRGEDRSQERTESAL
ncbi:MAG TPA: PadR family transcriptional regulator [Rhizobiaceae bacterium]|nr:PadR family transcriptional regulator [Rhizobiaceae bacterium]